MCPIIHHSHCCYALLACERVRARASLPVSGECTEHYSHITYDVSPQHQSTTMNEVVCVCFFHTRHDPRGERAYVATYGADRVAEVSVDLPTKIRRVGIAPAGMWVAVVSCLVFRLLTSLPPIAAAVAAASASFLYTRYTLGL